MSRFSTWLKFTYKYLGHPRWDTGISPPEIQEFISSHPAGRALDLGCGTGTNAILLARSGWDVTAVDFTELALRQAKQKASKAGANIQFLRKDVTRDLRLDGSYDLVFDLGCFHSIPYDERADYVKNIARYLKPGGHFLLYTVIRTVKGIYPGITEPDLELFTPILNLARRENGSDFDERRSVWLWFIRKQDS